MAKKRSKSPKYQAAKVKRTRAKEKKVAAQKRIDTLKGKLKTVKSKEKKDLVKARLAKAKTRRKKAGAQMKSQAAVMKDPYAKTVKKKVVKKKVVKKKKKVATKKDATTTKKVDTRQRTTGFNEYQIPDRTFDWETDPSEQALFASAIGRPDLAKTMLTGQYGPLASQQYKYGAGRTRINYGPGGTGSVRGVGDTSGLLGPLGTTAATTATGDGTVTAPGEPAGWTHPDYATFMDYTKAMHAKNYPPESAAATTLATTDPFAFEDWKAGPNRQMLAQASADQARENAFLQGPARSFGPSYGMPAGEPTPSYTMPAGGLVPSYGMPAGQPTPSYGMPAGQPVPSYSMAGRPLATPSITAQPSAYGVTGGAFGPSPLAVAASLPAGGAFGPSAASLQPDAVYPFMARGTNFPGSPSMAGLPPLAGPARFLDY